MGRRRSWPASVDEPTFLQLTDPEDLSLADSEKPGPLAAYYLEKRANLVRFFTVRTSSETEAEDIVQEIFLRIAHIDAATIENPSAYLYKLGTNILLDRVRARRRAEARDSAYFNTSADVTTGEPAVDSPSPEATWAARQRLERVMRAVEAFPVQRRRVFVMHKIEGLSYAEVAEALGVSRSAVEKHMMAALKTLSELDEP